MPAQRHTRPSSADRSIQLFEILRDRQATEDRRQLAFRELLDLETGWWGDAPLLTWVFAYSLAMGRAIMRRDDLSEDQIDWESVGEEALIALYNQAYQIASSPRAWLQGVIRNRIRQEKSALWPELVAAELRDELPQPSRDTHARGREIQHLRHYDELLAAIVALPPSLRVLAQLVLIDRHDLESARVLLGLTPQTTRKRIQRMREALRETIKP